MSTILPPDQPAVERIVAAALAEDAPWGDVTSNALIPEEVSATAELTARESGVFAGAPVLRTVFRQVDSAVAVELKIQDGERFEAGQVLAVASGSARSILLAERVGLNLLQRLCGIATLTAAFVAQAEGTKARIADTRKTTPGLRPLERYAVRCGGGHNHRYSLSDAVMAKDNHLAVITNGGRRDLTEALREAKARLPHTMHFEVEVDRAEQIEPVLAAGVDTIMLDNFSVDELRAGVAQVAGRALVEASGNVRLETVAGIAAAGVDIISSGALTHSVRSLDLGLDISIA
ncbi:nicotinate-nucleotide pyrophosphorylase [Arthrobacter crystallopoietes BAB-32]|uniref:Nicotinate-nucleotide pyrophosphorylase [carboxylating] n=1 Tax=Arthrobacter crystallopoietes BAB-32 TaxID=1246476 RepID=N1V4M9_9MICC|nr:carboxylating nicotinate-nucleotide diphosphorylase [Arthrobacter crystallopoietes]EMY34974.1 nicotinate-nucleotide pyrophosphorylase [Arthrobacter crystallopoietes BAB-32]